jgi:hypothetical protein
MKRIIFLLCTALVLPSCAGLPPIEPLDPSGHAALLARCRAPYLRAKYRLVHAIEATMPTGETGHLIGVTVADPAGRTLHSALMTIEGLVLFEARFDKAVTVDRAMPPFDSPGFAKGLMDDISLMFFAPMEPFSEAGTINGEPLCRYRGEGGTVDVIANSDGGFTVRRYRGSNSLARELRFSAPDSRGISKQMELAARGVLGYTLHMELIKAERI